MNTEQSAVFIPFETMKAELKRILLKNGFAAEKAEKCAAVFAESTLDGVYSHGINRFPRFISYIQKGYVLPDGEPEMVSRSGAWEQWNGNLGPGPLNGLFATGRAMAVADAHGIGLVALANTNHWMRGGTYGWHAASKGYIFTGWTNTTANMPLWGGTTPKQGNNPLVIAIPNGNQPVVLDMAMSQFSFGKMEAMRSAGEKLPVPGGYDLNGNLTNDPGEILDSWRSLPIGYWKGSALSLMLDMLATVLSAGNSTAQISRFPAEYGVSQVFIAIAVEKLVSLQSAGAAIDAIIRDMKNSGLAEENSPVRFPGERALQIRKKNLENGIPVEAAVWEEIMALSP